MSDHHESNWLNATRVECPHCRASIFQVDRSPFFDSWRLYCGSCARSVDVSYYDEVVREMAKKLRSDRPELLAEVEHRLRACDCGGSFSMAAPRRCHQCNTIVVTDADVDLYSWVGPELGDRDPTDAEVKAFDQYQRDFVRSRSIWS